MTTIGHILSSVGSLGGLVCFILVVVQMFKREKMGLAIACILLFFCCAIGYLITFIYGWVVNKQWSITPVMLVWTVCIVLNIIGGVLSPIDVTEIQRHLQLAK